VTSSHQTIATRFFDAYNAADADALREVAADDIHWEHHNKFQGKGLEGLLQSIKSFLDRAPDRRFTEPSRTAENGDCLFIEHQWKGTPAVTDPRWRWEEGVPRTSDVLSLLVIRDGKVVEWSDYG